MGKGGGQSGPTDRANGKKMGPTAQNFARWVKIQWRREYGGGEVPGHVPPIGQKLKFLPLKIVILCQNRKISRALGAISMHFDCFLPKNHKIFKSREKNIKFSS